MPVTHIYWFAYFSTDEPSVRYRGLYALEHMQKTHGITYDIVYPGYSHRAVHAFIKTYFSVLINRKPGSVIVFEKIHTRRVYATALKVLLKLHPKMTIYDIDDADYLKFPPKNIYHFMKNCSACTVGSTALAKFTNELNKNVLLLTSPVVAHAEVKAARNSIFTIGWVGYYNAHRESLLQLLFPSLKNLSFPIKLILLGVTKPQHFAEVNEYFNCAAHVTIEMPQNINWHDEQALYNKISTFDIGVAPLLPTSINKAKSAFKVKQYLSCGVPVLGSGFGENEQFLNHGVNGFVCNDSSSYAEYIRLVAAMADDTYASMSENAFRSREAFSMKNYCSTFISYLNKGIQAAEPAQAG